MWQNIVQPLDSGLPADSKSLGRARVHIISYASYLNLLAKAFVELRGATHVEVQVKPSHLSSAAGRLRCK